MTDSAGSPEITKQNRLHAVFLAISPLVPVHHLQNKVFQYETVLLLEDEFRDFFHFQFVASIRDFRRKSLGNHIKG